MSLTQTFKDGQIISSSMRADANSAGYREKVPCRITIITIASAEPIVTHSDDIPTISSDRVIVYTDADSGTRVTMGIGGTDRYAIEHGVPSPANAKRAADAAELKEQRQQAQVRLLQKVADKIGVPLHKLRAIGSEGVAQLVNLLTDKGLPQVVDVCEVLMNRPEFAEPPLTLDAPADEALADLREGRTAPLKNTYFAESETAGAGFTDAISKLPDVPLGAAVESDRYHIRTYPTGFEATLTRTYKDAVLLGVPADNGQ